MNKILKWWNNTKLVQKKKQEWYQINNKKTNDLNWPQDVYHDHEEEFQESDWVYNTGNRCERYVTWFFHIFTRRCTIIERQPLYNDGEKPGFETHHPFWMTTYKVHEDIGNDLEYIPQSELSF